MIHLRFKKVYKRFTLASTAVVLSDFLPRSGIRTPHLPALSPGLHIRPPKNCIQFVTIYEPLIFIILPLRSNERRKWTLESLFLIIWPLRILGIVRILLFYHYSTIKNNTAIKIKSTQKVNVRLHPSTFTDLSFIFVPNLLIYNLLIAVTAHSLSL